MCRGGGEYVNSFMSVLKCPFPPHPFRKKVWYLGRLRLLGFGVLGRCITTIVEDSSGRFWQLCLVSTFHAKLPLETALLFLCSGIAWSLIKSWRVYIPKSPRRSFILWRSLLLPHKFGLRRLGVMSDVHRLFFITRADHVRCGYIALILGWQNLPPFNVLNHLKSRRWLVAKATLVFQYLRKFIFGQNHSRYERTMRLVIFRYAYQVLWSCHQTNSGKHSFVCALHLNI